MTLEIDIGKQIIDYVLIRFKSVYCDTLVKEKKKRLLHKFSEIDAALLIDLNYSTEVVKIAKKLNFSIHI